MYFKTCLITVDIKFGFRFLVFQVSQADICVVYMHIKWMNARVVEDLLTFSIVIFV